MGFKSELLEATIESDADETAASADALWLGWLIIVVLLALAMLLVRFIYRRVKSIGSCLIKRQ